MKRSSWWISCATIGPLGYFYASGTIATAATMPFMYLVHTYLPSSYAYGGIVVILCIGSLFIISKALSIMQCANDPASIVLDEACGCLVTFWNIPLSPSTIIIGFILFRFFDIFKRGPLAYCEYIVGAWGILLDDIVAGLISNILLRIIIGYYS